MSSLLVVLGVLAAATVIGLVRRARDGRFRPVRDDGPVGAMARAPAGSSPTGPATGPLSSAPAGPLSSDPAADADRLAAVGVRPEPGTVTLLQFSSAFCAPCRATRAVLADVARTLPGVRHVEVDAEAHLDTVRALGILRTPTTLVVDGDGRVVHRASGRPRREQVLTVVADVLSAPAGDAR